MVAYVAGPKVAEEERGQARHEELLWLCAGERAHARWLTAYARTYGMLQLCGYAHNGGTAAAIGT
jgi:hypothetical protein